ncbi:NYN domain-containing protein [Methanococcoides sp. SA1]|nr:NYN domain-containing protein [Methanococcoides sp. SA1]
MNNQRVAIFIDGSNLYHNLKRYKIKSTFEEIINKVETKREIVDIFYYTALLDKKIDEKRYQSHKTFLDKIKRIPNFNVVLCKLRRIMLEDGSTDFAIKGDDVHLATDLIRGLYEDLYDIAIVVSGDADFIPAIKLAQKNGKKIINAFFPKSSSYQLRNCCEGSINLKKALS